MDDLILQPAALDLVEVEATTMGPTDPGFFLFREWCAMTDVEQSATLLNQHNLTDIMYVNTDLEFQETSITSSPAHRPHRPHR